MIRNIILLDSPKPWQFGFQSPATHIQEGIIFFHNYVILFLIFIFTLVAWMLFKSIQSFSESRNEVVRNISHNSLLEILWTVTPAIVLLFIAIPSFSLLYSTEDVAEPTATIKIIGRQWYWTYEVDGKFTEEVKDYIDDYTTTVTKSMKRSGKHTCRLVRGKVEVDPDVEFIQNIIKLGNKCYFDKKKWSYMECKTHKTKFPKTIKMTHGPVVFDSYMITTEDLQIGMLRLLEVDKRLFLPAWANVRFVITSSDVIHSWAVPAFGIKLDAIPGRLNSHTTLIKRQGVFYGQCSELCGVNHGYMPIVVESTTHERFADWVHTHSELRTAQDLKKFFELRDVIFTFTKIPNK